MAYKDPARKRERAREYYLVNREAIRDKNVAWRKANPEKVNGYNHKYRAANPEQAREWDRASRLKLRMTVLGHYGLFCACCGESELAFLTLEHVGGTGAEHRRRTGNNQGAIYRDIIRQGFPEGYETLCFNCNCARHINGGICPHQERVLRLISSALRIAFRFYKTSSARRLRPRRRVG